MKTDSNYIYPPSRKLALSEEILMQVEKPARYIGGEKNSIYMEPSEVAVHFCMCFPDVYEIGMSHLGIRYSTKCSILLRTLIAREFTAPGLTSMR